jgi:hypothetical protein
MRRPDGAPARQHRNVIITSDVDDLCRSDPTVLLERS